MIGWQRLTLQKQSPSLVIQKLSYTTPFLNGDVPTTLENTYSIASLVLHILKQLDVSSLLTEN